MQKNNKYIYSTQSRYVNEIIKNWLNRETAAVFDLSWKWELIFTLSIAIYHWISLNVQKIILQWKFQKFSDFYKKNMDLLPVIIIFKDSIDNKNLVTKNIYKSYNSEIFSHQYYKINELWKLKKIHKIIKISLNEVFKAEKDIKNYLKSSEDRFFNKIWENNEIIRFKGEELIDKDQIWILCTNLWKSIINKI